MKNNITIRNAKFEDVKYMIDFFYIIPIKNILKRKMICKTSFVAEVNQKVVGIIISEKSLLGSYDIKIIEVSLKYRKKGIGSLLIKSIKDMAKDRAITVYYPNDNAIEAFYSSNGFIVGDNVKVAISCSNKDVVKKGKWKGLNITWIIWYNFINSFKFWRV